MMASSIIYDFTFKSPCFGFNADFCLNLKCKSGKAVIVNINYDALTLPDLIK